MAGDDEMERRARTAAINQDAGVALRRAQQAIARLNRSVGELNSQVEHQKGVGHEHE